ncbi:hypothetical protein ACHAWO_007768 [Cyclotella atomus]|uniref:Uncharacterized protein n=1 Tax=Cyclotella atomus TaxID=382360 RepID=A0ABD3N601_9STRA
MLQKRVQQNSYVAFNRASPRASTPCIIRHVSNVLEYAAKKDVTSMTANEVDAAATYRRESDTSFNGSDLSIESQAIYNSQRRKSSFLNTSSRSLDAPTKRVLFAQHSQVKVYEVNLAHRKSYTSEDEHGFKVEAYIDALHIREAITTHPGASVKNPIKHLIELNLLSAEELVGPEHKISEVSGKKKKEGSCNDCYCSCCILVGSSRGNAKDEPKD